MIPGPVVKKRFTLSVLTKGPAEVRPWASIGARCAFVDLTLLHPERAKDAKQFFYRR